MRPTFGPWTPMGTCYSGGLLRNWRGVSNLRDCHEIISSIEQRNAG